MHPLRSRALRGALAILVLAWAAAPAAAEEGDVEARIRRLEALVERQAQEIEALRRQAAPQPPSAAPGRVAVSAPVPASVPVSPAAPPTGAPAPSPSPVLPPPAGPVLVDTARGRGGVRLGGYLTAEYVAPSNRNSYVDLHRLILSVDAALTDRIDLSAEIEWEHGGVHDELDGVIYIEYADIRFHVCDAFVPKVGALRIPFGRYNLYHDDPLNDFTLRPFVGRYLVPTGFGQPGLGAEGAMPFGRGHVFTYDVAVTEGYEDELTASRGVRRARQAWQQDNNEDKQVWGRVGATWCTPWLDHLDVGASGTWGRYDDEGRNDLFGWGFDLMARKGPFEVTAEYVAYDLERDAADPATAVEGQSGWLVQGAWHFMPPGWRRSRGALVTDTSHFTLAVRWQQMDLDDRVRGAAFEDDLDAWTVGLNYRITEGMVFRVDYTWYDAVGRPDVEEFTASFSTYF